MVEWQFYLGGVVGALIATILNFNFKQWLIYSIILSLFVLMEFRIEKRKNKNEIGQNKIRRKNK